MSNSKDLKPKADETKGDTGASTVSDSKDLKPKDFPELSWEPDNLSESLELLYKYASEEAARFSRWYYEKRRWKKFMGITLRILAIVLMAVGGIIPIIDKIPPFIATILISIAALLVMLDRFVGFTTGWIRFILTGQELAQLLEVFRLDWQHHRVGLEKNKITAEQAEELIFLCRTFLMQIHGVMRKETEMWATEFQNMLKEIDEASKTTAKIKELGAVSVEVTNGADCSDGWRMKIDRGPERTYRGTSASAKDITPGIHTVHIEGTVNNDILQAEKPVSVSGGAIVNVELTLK
ncbi:MAG: SLATT domain-containing protein [Desulfobacteraceae bacterium]|nr:SLATT domain-containing protein [Desulfobacteraceae bacterium]